MPTELRPFCNSRKKLERAHEHLNALNASIAAYLAGKWCTVEVGESPSGKFQLRMAIHGTPHKYDVIIGDVVHNMRSALDLMAVELVRINGGDETRVQFPFSTDAAGLAKAIKGSHFDRASAAARNIVATLQPYGGGNDLLRALHDLDLDDKHRLIPPDAFTPTTPEVTVEMVDGKPTARLLPNSAPSLKFVFPDSGPLPGRSVVEELKNMLVLVTRIVDDFEAICP